MSIPVRLSALFVLLAAVTHAQSLRLPGRRSWDTGRWTMARRRGSCAIRRPTPCRARLAYARDLPTVQQAGRTVLTADAQQVIAAVELALCMDTTNVPRSTAGSASSRPRYPARPQASCSLRSRAGALPLHSVLGRRPPARRRQRAGSTGLGLCNGSWMGLPGRTCEKWPVQAGCTVFTHRPGFGSPLVFPEPDGRCSMRSSIIRATCLGGIFSTK